MPADPPRCEPPEEARHERWHWLQAPDDIQPWECGRKVGVWGDGFGGYFTPEVMARCGYRWAAVIKPPDRP